MHTSQTIKVAYAAVPKEGGTFTFYRNIRGPLAAHGVEISCVSVGLGQAGLWNPRYADDGCVLLARESANVKRQSKAFVEWCVAQGIDIVIGVNSAAILSAIPHLPPEIVAVARCANGFDHGYRITLAGRERLARIVALTPRLRDDLIAHYGAPAERVTLIANGIDPAPFEAAAAAPRGERERLRLGFLGRLEHNQKGVLHIPAVVRALNAADIPFTLSIAGQGRHEGELRSAMAAEIDSGQVDFRGVLMPPQIPGFLAATDVLLFPSHFEGCPNVLLETLMAGVTAVAWRVEGITDFVLKEGVTGELAEMGDTDAFAKAIAALHRDRPRLRRMAAAAAADARERFTNQRAAADYAAVFEAALAERGRAVAAPWSAFKVNENFARTTVQKLRAFAKRRLYRHGILRPT